MWRVDGNNTLEVEDPCKEIVVVSKPVFFSPLSRLLYKNVFSVCVSTGLF